jgi:hypothetical protein
MKLLNTVRIAVAVTILAVAAVAAVDSALALGVRVLNPLLHHQFRLDLGLTGMTIRHRLKPSPRSSVAPCVCNSHRLESTMMLHRIRIALAATLLAFAAVSAVDSASAGDFGPYTRPISPGMDSLTLATWRAMGSQSGGEVFADFSLNGWGVILLPFIEQDNLSHLGP